MSAHDPLPLYALDTLPDDERAAFEAHLAECEQCRLELASYGPALSGLARGAEARPDHRLRADVLARIRETPQHGAAVPAPAAGGPAPRRRAAPRRERWLALAAAILVCALVAVSATSLVMWRRAADMEREMARAPAAGELAAVLAADDAALVDVETDLSGSLRVAVAPSMDRGMVIADGLQAPPQDLMYQLWVMEDGQPRSAGMLARDTGVVAELSGIAAAEGIAVSVEPPSGSAAPTGPVVAHADLGADGR